MTKLKVTLTKSVIGSTDSQRATVRGLGLRKIRSTKVLNNTPAIRGMIKKVIHLVEVEEVTE
jgi:large subunit ribosomal protein L30